MGTRRFRISRSAVIKLLPLSRWFGAHTNPSSRIHIGTIMISMESPFRDLGSIQFLSHHRLDWVSPKRNNGSNAHFGSPLAFRCIPSLLLASLLFAYRNLGLFRREQPGFEHIARGASAQ